ncbi:MAG TPA: XdhC family protein [Streptosporangiaceae bacterium]
MGMDGWAFLEHGADLARRGESFALATVVWRQGPSSGKESCRAIVTASGELHGWIGGACAEPVVIRQAREVIAEGVPRLLLLGPADQFSESQFGPALPDGMLFVPISCSSEGSLEVYIEPVQPAPHLVVVGHSPMVQTLGELARALGWRADVIAGEDFTAGQASTRSIVVVATQGHHDEEAVTAAIEARAAYVGLVGSARRGQTVLGYLAERGLPRAELDRVHSPAGLDLGRTTHREIAVAILAELVQLKAAGQLASAEASVTAGVYEAGGVRGAGKTDGASGASGAGGAGGSAVMGEAVDPVCGMTVTAGPGSLPLERDGVTHYFCCAGCRDAFEKDESRC